MQTGATDESCQEKEFIKSSSNAIGHMFGITSSTVNKILNSLMYEGIVIRRKVLTKRGYYYEYKIIDDTIKIKEDNINISCETIVGNVDDNISVETNGGEIEIGFFNEFILDILRACDDETVKIRFKTSVSPMIITPVEGDKYLYLLLQSFFHIHF